MPRFEFASPGAEAGNALKQALIVQEARRRQQMLDAIMAAREGRLMKSTDAQIRNTDAATASLDESRKSQAAYRDQQAAALAQGQFAGSHMIGDEVSGEDASKFPGMVAPGKVTQGAHLGTDESGVDQYEVSQGKPTFRGTPAQREKQQQQEAVRQIISSNPDIANHPGIKTALQLAEATGDYSGIYGAIGQMTRANSTPETLQQQANAANAAGNTAEYQRLLKVIKETGQADDRPFQPFVFQTPGQAPVLIDRGSGKSRDVLGPDGNPLPQVKTSDQVNREASIGRANPFLESVAELTDRINVNSGVYAKMVGGAEKVAAKVNLDDDVAEYQSMVQAFTPLWARALGHNGVLTQQDVDSAREALPKPGDSKSLRDRKMARIQRIFAAQQEGGSSVSTTPSTAPVTTPPPGAKIRRWNPQTKRPE